MKSLYFVTLIHQDKFSPPQHINVCKFNRVRALKFPFKGGESGCLPHDRFLQFVVNCPHEFSAKEPSDLMFGAEFLGTVNTLDCPLILATPSLNGLGREEGVSWQSVVKIEFPKIPFHSVQLLL